MFLSVSCHYFCLTPMQIAHRNCDNHDICCSAHFAREPYYIFMFFFQSLSKSCNVFSKTLSQSQYIIFMMVAEKKKAINFPAL